MANPQVTVTPNNALFWNYTKSILKLTFIFLLIGSLWRALFLILFSHPLDELKNNFIDVFRAFVLGFRFDLTVLGYTHIIPFLIFLVLALLSPWVKIGNLLNKFLRWYYVFFLFLILFVEVIDLYFFRFYNDHINVLIFGMFEDDTIALLKTFYHNYPIFWFMGGCGLAIYILMKYLKKIFPDQEGFPQAYISTPIFQILRVGFFTFILFFVNGLAARGSLGMFPLTEMDTAISKSEFINQLNFNSMHALSRAIKLKTQQNESWDSNIVHLGYSSNFKQAYADFFNLNLNQIPNDPNALLTHKTAKNIWAEKTKPHVLVFILESFGAYWLQWNSEEFDLMGGLKKHFEQDTYTPYFLSATGATIGSLGAMISGLPHRPISEFLTESPYLQVRLSTSPARVFKQAGYHTRFIYGGNTGWRDANKFAKFQGFDSVEGEQDIPTNGKKHDWGVYDEDLWSYLKTTLENAKTPEYILVLTTTNHPPYELPDTYQPKTLKIPDVLNQRITENHELALKRFQTYRYANQKFSEFMDWLKSSSIKDRAVVAATGDHTFWLINFSEQEFFQKGAVPFYLYTPDAIKVKFPQPTFGSHPDIFPTLYNLTLSETEYDSLAQNLLDPNHENYAYNFQKFVTHPNGGVFFTNVNEPRFLKWEPGFSLLSLSTANPDTERIFKKYKSMMAIIDYYLYSQKRKQEHENSSR